MKCEFYYRILEDHANKHQLKVTHLKCSFSSHS